jgi:membrane protein insertase Oxa1/YidC/SpoIIIJ
MSDEKKIVKGGVRANLALLISIIALILAIIVFNQSGGKADLQAQLKELKTKMEGIKRETSEQMGKLREETANTMEKIGKAIKKKEDKAGKQ